LSAETAEIEIETGVAEKSSWDQANICQKLGLVWRNRKKISQIIKDYFYLPFFLLIILCPLSFPSSSLPHICPDNLKRLRYNLQLDLSGLENPKPSTTSGRGQHRCF
jgi:hypothetical protein